MRITRNPDGQFLECANCGGDMEGVNLDGYLWHCIDCGWHAQYVVDDAEDIDHGLDESTLCDCEDTPYGDRTWWGIIDG